MNYDEMSIDELIEYDDRLGCPSPGVHIIKRCAARDAILDLAEAMDAEGLVVVPWVMSGAMLNAMRVSFEDCADFAWECGGHGFYHDDATQMWNAAIEAAPLMGVE